MTDEAQIRTSLQINKNSIEYRSLPAAFSADVSGTKGPTPGAVTFSTAGEDVDLTGLTVPGLCRLQNQDSTNYVSYGIWDPEGNTFYPLGELLPGESYILRLSRDIEEEFGTGGGTTGPNTNRLRIKADTAACVVLVEVFEA